MSSANVVQDSTMEYKKALPIISIYFLEYSLKNTDAPVIAVKRKYYDVALNKELTIKEDFIESLTHDSFVVQIPYLKAHRRNHLEIMLSVFDQSNSSDDNHILNIKEENFPTKYRSIIRRLQKAQSKQEIRQTMDAEDIYLSTLEDYERAVSKRDLIIQESIKTIEAKEATISEKEKEISEKEKVISEKEQTIVNLAKLLKANGMSHAEIAQKTKLSEDEIMKL
jgi:hypothetical protein